MNLLAGEGLVLHSTVGSDEQCGEQNKGKLADRSHAEPNSEGSLRGQNWICHDTAIKRTSHMS